MGLRWRAGLIVLGLVANLLPGTAAWADPPTVAGRVAWLAGSVNLKPAATGVEAPAALNWPLTRGDVLSSGASGRAEVWIGSTAVRLDVDTRLVFERLDEHALALHLERGSLALRAATAEAAEGIEVNTPLGRVHPLAPGEIRADVQGTAVAVSASQGALRWQSGDTSMTIQPGQRVLARPATTGFSVETVAPVEDDFAGFVRARERAYAGRSSARYVSPEMTGVETLDGYGHWSQVAEYGPVWWPDVGPDWAPYRSGRWVWVAPWGWSWLATEPWGFAPFHYGRWVSWQGRWGWVPGGYVARPVYAPALVRWQGAPGPSTQWAPLGPREVYEPGFDASIGYVRRINGGHGGWRH